jgi:hypothetical protein
MDGFYNNGEGQIEGEEESWWSVQVEILQTLFFVIGVSHEQARVFSLFAFKGMSLTLRN